METLRKRITPQQLDDLKHRRITARELARQLGVSECWMSLNFSGAKIGKVEPFRRQDKKQLVAARREYRDGLARQILTGRLTIEIAARQAGCTTRTMYRHVTRVKNAD